MLTGKLLRARFVKDAIVPLYLDVQADEPRQWAELLLGIYRGASGRTRGEIEADVEESLSGLPNTLVQQGLAKLLEDRCDFEIQSDRPPEEIREEVFRVAAEARLAGQFDREAILRQASATLELEPSIVEAGMFADLKAEQRLTKFDDITVDRLLDRYNAALAQAVLLKSVGLEAVVRGETPARLRRLLRQVKFHRLLCEAQSDGPKEVRLKIEGPLSLFSATQKYGLQLALFLPALLLCKDFELTAELRWGPERKPKRFRLASSDNLVSPQVDVGTYVPPEVSMFAELFRKKIQDFELIEQPDVVLAGGHFWVPDFRLVHRETGRSLGLEILGFWRRSGIEKHLERLRALDEPFLLAVSEKLKVEESTELPEGVVRFRDMPVPDQVAAAARARLAATR